MTSFARNLVCLTLLLAGCSSGDGGTNEQSGNPATGTTDGSNMPGDDGTGGDTMGGASDPNAGGSGQVDAPPNGEKKPTAIVAGCDGQKLREGISADPGKHGPWPVGAVTTMLGGVVSEVWYPAKQGSQVGKKRIAYDMREHLPPDDAKKIPDDHNPTHIGDCYRDIPLDDEAGPYPVILFIHGTAGFRTTNLDNATHWASRGFVVVAADHPGIQLKDLLGAASLSGGGGGGNQAQDGRKMLAELAMTTGDVAFLKDHIDMTRVAAIGHSAGGGAVAGYGDIADVIVVYAAGGSISNAMRTKSMMALMGATDGVAGAGTGGFDGSNTQTKRYVSIAKGGHLVGGNLCTLRDPTDPNKDIVDLAEQYKLGGILGQIPGAVRAGFGGLFDGCNDPMDDPMGKFIPATRGIEVMNYVTSAVFEETLHCGVNKSAEALSNTMTVFGADVAAYMEDLP